MGTIDYRPAVLDDIPQLVNLMNAQYARKKTESYFRWQYFDSAYPTVLICACLEDRPQGMFGLQRRVTASGVQIGQAIDLLISPELRGMGVFSEMGSRAAAFFPALDAFCVLPNLNGRNACVKSLGWPVIAKIDSMCLDFYLQPPEDLYSRQGSVSEKWTSFLYNREIREWRYDRHPDYLYDTVKLKTGEFAVTKIFQDPITGKRYGDIVDFSCDCGNRRLLQALFSMAVQRLNTAGIESVTTWALPHTTLFGVLTKLGFRSFTQERYFCVKALKPEFEYLQDIGNWHLVQADAEFY